MQDFTKQNNLQIPTQSQQPKWLSSDRFWNLFFWLFMSTGFSISGFLKDQLDASFLGAFLMLCTLVATGVLLNTFNAPSKTHFRVLSKSSLAGFILFITLGASIFIIASIFTNKTNPSIGFSVIFSVFFELLAPLSLFFIYLNCPISILFNRRVWLSKPMPYSTISDSSRRSSEESSKRRYSIARSHYPGNMHHRPTHRR